MSRVRVQTPNIIKKNYWQENEERYGRNTSLYESQNIYKKNKKDNQRVKNKLAVWNHLNKRNLHKKQQCKV